MTTLICKVVPPGSQSLPSPLHLVPGDTLSIHVVSYGEVTMDWYSEFSAERPITIEFDYMEIKDPGAPGKLFTEIRHEETGKLGPR